MSRTLLVNTLNKIDSELNQVHPSASGAGRKSMYGYGGVTVPVYGHGGYGGLTPVPDAWGGARTREEVFAAKEVAETNPWLNFLATYAATNQISYTDALARSKNGALRDEYTTWLSNNRELLERNEAAKAYRKQHGYRPPPPPMPRAQWGTRPKVVPISQQILSTSMSAPAAGYRKMYGRGRIYG